MMFSYSVSQNGESVEFSGDNDRDLRERAHRVARKSLDMASGAVTIRRKRGVDKWRIVAELGK